MVKQYSTQSGDQWDIIAKRVYGSELHADHLMANNFPLLDTYEFQSGVLLNTPPLPTQSPRGPLPEWR